MFVIKEGRFNLSWTHILDWFRWGQESHTKFLWRKARCWGIATIFWQENGKSNPTVQEGWIWAELNKSLCVHTSFRCFALHRELSTSFQVFCSALVSLCIDVYFSHTYHSHHSPLSQPQSLCSSPGTLPSTFQVSSLLWGCELVFSALLAASESNSAREPTAPCVASRREWAPCSLGTSLLHARSPGWRRCCWSLPKGKARGQSRWSSASLQEIIFHALRHWF